MCVHFTKKTASWQHAVRLDYFTESPYIYNELSVLLTHFCIISLMNADYFLKINTY